ncbi:hypothetical protein DCAR_0102338 [Daucus carota subsp. sativus]|uniref:Uncharacterized protein n=1 Tax=Daucus carota subsp. sativus TaxID=79200 RepID=A0A166H1D5_DAUCS|nr:hypothetical protein DCAR_0102338 [Daucus carota subsp. sativus]
MSSSVYRTPKGLCTSWEATIILKVKVLARESNLYGQKGSVRGRKRLWDTDPGMLIMLRRGMDSRVKSDTIVLVLNLMDIGQVSLLRGYVCTYWVGIQCNKNGTRVIVVHLPGVGLYGSTPVKSIEKLDALQDSIKNNGDVIHRLIIVIRMMHDGHVADHETSTAREMPF